MNDWRLLAASFQNQCLDKESRMQTFTAFKLSSCSHGDMVENKQRQTCPQQQIHIKVLNPGQRRMSQSIDGWIIKVFTEAITQRQAGKLSAGHQWSHMQPPAIARWRPFARVIVGVHAHRLLSSNLAESQIFCSPRTDTSSLRLPKQHNYRQKQTARVRSHARTYFCWVAAGCAPLPGLAAGGLAEGPPASASPGRFPSSPVSRRSTAATPVLMGGGWTFFFFSIYKGDMLEQNRMFEFKLRE